MVSLAERLRPQGERLLPLHGTLGERLPPQGERLLPQHGTFGEKIPPQHGTSAVYITEKKTFIRISFSPHHRHLEEMMTALGRIAA